MKLIDKIKQRSAKIGIIGLGYVGLPLAVEFAQAGFKVYGIDLDENKLAIINNGISPVEGVSSNKLKRLIQNHCLLAHNSYQVLAETEVAIICVPTPIKPTKEPDLSSIIEATKGIANHFQKNSLVVLESTTYPGTTEEIVLPLLESQGFKVGKDFFLAFSPERIDPGNPKYKIKNIPKIVGGVTPNCTELAKALYQQIVNEIIVVSSPKTAELTKLVENVFRSVNIALANELTLLCDKMDIDVWEVIEAAATKPFGFMKFQPGPGLGGHCIPIDPFYLAWRARKYGFYTKFIELSGEINENMPFYVVNKISTSLNNRYKSVKGSKILILGVAYKKGISDTRESPAFKIMELLLQRGALLSYNDPYVSQIEVNGTKFNSSTLDGNILRNSDCVVIVTDHTLYDYPFIVEHAPLILDTRNALKGYPQNKIVRL